jgi:hypothetical protein
MKKTIFCLLFAFSLYATTVAPTHAIVCSNCSTIIQQMIDYVRQGFQYAKDTITASQTTVTAVQQTLETVNNTILIPMRDAAALMVLMQSGDNIQNLILGSLGTDPLLIKNPEQYFKNKAVASLGASYNEIAAYRSVFGGSVLEALVKNSRYTYMDHSQKLQAIGSSQVPSIIQRNACTDEKLNQLAREDLMASNQQNDEMAFQARKAHFYNSFCVGDPARDPETAQALQALQRARPDIGGWDSWLALTSGDNQYARVTNLQLEIDKRAREVVEAAKTDYVIGGGIASLTNCTKEIETDLNGVPMSSGTCVAGEIKQAGSVLASTYKEVVETPMKLIRESFGTGAGSLISTAFNTLNIIKGISSSIDSMGGSGGGGQNNTSAPITSTSPAVQDLTNNQQAKTTLTSPAKRQLETHQTALNTLQTTDQNYISQINFYQSQLDSMKQCYDNLVTEFGIQSDQRVVAALDYYQSTTQSNTVLKNNLSQELGKISTAKTLVSNTISQINASNSSQEITSLFNTYQSTVESQGLPGITAAATRDGEYINFQGTVEQSMSQVGPLYGYKETCSSIRAQFEAQNYGGM